MKYSYLQRDELSPVTLSVYICPSQLYLTVNRKTLASKVVIVHRCIIWNISKGSSFALPGWSMHGNDIDSGSKWFDWFYYIDICEYKTGTST